MRVTAPRFPLLTAVATGVATVAAVAQYAVPGMVPALQRVPGGGVPDGQWWRLVTPLLVQTLGWYQVVANLGSLLVVGAVAEHVLGRSWWLALAVAGTVGGQLAAYHWHQSGGGDSIAICGLAAGVVITLLVRPAAGPCLAHLAVVGYVAALTGWGVFGPRGAALACVLAGIGTVVLHRWGFPGADRIPLVGCVAAALALLVLEKDLHGASLVAGMLFTVAVLAVRKPAVVAPIRGASGGTRRRSDS